MNFRNASAFLVAFACSVSASAETRTISAIIDTAQENPAPVGASDSAGGFAFLQFDDNSNELSWDIAWQDLTGAPTGMHIHGPAPVGSNAGVVVNLGNIGGLTSPSSGSTTLTGDVASYLLDGQTYVNIHTASNGPGEIRGQIKPTNINLTATLDTAQEIPAPTGVPAGAGGSAHVAYDPDTNTLGWMIEWDDLSGPATGMHFHGPAGFGETAGVQVNVGNISGLSSPSIGSTQISDELASELTNGQWYLNIHTAANGPGEIRGQLVPEPQSAILLGLVLLPLPFRTSRLKSADNGTQDGN